MCKLELVKYIFKVIKCHYNLIICFHNIHQNNPLQKPFSNLFHCQQQFDPVSKG